MSVLLEGRQPVARLSVDLPSGRWVRAAYSTVHEVIDADRVENLLNGFDVKVSNAKRWDRDEYQTLPLAIPINGDESEFVLV